MHGTTPQQATGHDLWLDWMRALAALLVLLGHVRGGFFVQWSDLAPASQSGLNYVLFFMTRLGREAVVVFFVLSGYLVGGQALAEARRGLFSTQSYFVARVSRLYTVLIPALALTAAMDWGAGTWTQQANGPGSLLVNLLFLQGVFGPVYGSNGPLWSLAYEWWFYVLFGLGVSTLVRPGVVRRGLSAGLLLLVAAVLLRQCSQMLAMFPLWLGGVALRAAPAPRTRVRPPVVLLGLAFLCAMMLLSGMRLDLFGDYLVGTGTAVLIGLLRGAAPMSSPLLRQGSVLASFSFTLYATHYPINNLVDRRLLSHRLTHAEPGDWLVLSLLATLIAVLAFLWYLPFERHTSRVRRLMLQALGARVGGPAPRLVRIPETSA